MQYKDHFVVVISEIGGDFWWATVTGYYTSKSLDVDIWKESVHFIAMHFGMTNRRTVVFKTHAGTKNFQPPLFEWFSYKSVMPDDGEYNDEVVNALGGR